ncbi:MAG: hypothetical protein QXT26_07550, partial [Thermoproteota archaeon]
MSSSDSKIEFVRGLTIRASVIGAILSALLTVGFVIGGYTIGFLYSGIDYVAGAPNGPTIFHFFWPVGLWTLLLLVLVNSPLPRRLRLTKQELTIILTMCMVTIPLVMGYTPWAFGIGTRHAMGGGAVYSPGGEPNILIKWICFWWSRVDLYPVEPHLYVNGGWIGRPINVVLPCPLHLYAPAI